MESFVSNSNVIKSLFLLMLAVSGNFIGQTLSCKAQYYASNYMLVKHFIVLLMIYFTLNFTSTENTHPLDSLKTSLLIWVGFLLFTKLTEFTTILSILLLIIIYLIDNYVKYYQNLNTLTDSQKQHYIEKLNNYRNVLLHCLYFVLVFGFILYFKKQLNDYGKDFNLIKFLFGIPLCSN